MSEMIEHKWHCTKCGESGVHEHSEDASLYHVYQAIIEAHDLASPHCWYAPAPPKKMEEDHAME